MKPTKQQQKAITTEGNILLSALAGCAKTSTLEMIAASLSETDALYLAFNKRTAEEAKKKLPKWVEVKTLNALGHQAWAKKIGRRPSLSISKVYFLAKEADYEMSVVTAVNMARNYGLGGKFATFSADTSWSDVQELTGKEFCAKKAANLLELSVKAAFNGKIDFNDQIYMSCCYGGGFTKRDLVFVDEAQDLSPMNLRMVEKTTKNRIIAVGDPNQSIYAFRGAAADALEEIKKKYNPIVLPLTINFRCSQEVVRYVNKFIPELCTHPNAPKGSVSTAGSFNLASIPPQSAVLCRNNAPLFRAGIKLLAAGRAAIYFGSTALKKSVSKMLDKVEEDPFYLEKQSELALRLLPSKAEALNDRILCCKALIESGEPKKKLNTLCAKRTAEIVLSTGHRAKGFEWDNVFLLDKHLIPSKYAKSEVALQQERNLLYVMCTRAKINLTFINSEDLT